MEINDPIYNEKLFKYSNPEEKHTFVNGLDVYYRMKNDYEKSINSVVKKIMEKTLNKQKRRKLYKEFVPKCINCKQPGGTIFTEKFVNEPYTNRIARAFCGNKTSPCQLDITINLGHVLNLKTELTRVKNDNEELKNLIIKNKNNLIFGLKNEEEELKIFDELKDMTNSNSEHLGFLEEVFIEQTDNIERTNMIENLRKDIVDDIFYIKNYMSDFNKTEKLSFVRDAVEMYVNNLYFDPTRYVPPEKMTIMEKYRKLEWPVNMVEYEENGICALRQMHYNPESLEYNGSDKFGVEKLVVGVGERVKKRKTNKTIKRTPESKSMTKNKTKKASLIVVDEDEDQEQVPEQGPDQVQEPVLEEKESIISEE